MAGHFDDTIARARPVNDWRSRPAVALPRRDSWRRVQKCLYSVSQVRVGGVRRIARGDGTAARVREMVRVSWVRRTVRDDARLEAAERTDVGFGKTSTCRLTGRKG